MKWLPSPETRAAVLTHPFFLAGVAVVVLLGLTAATLVVADSVRGGGASAARPTVVVSVATGAADHSDGAVTTSGISGTTKGTTAVRSAPGTRTPVLGTLPAKSDVQIDGRTTDAKWMRVAFPPGNSAGLHGWIDAASLDIIGDPASLVVATPEPPVFVELPTQPPAPVVVTTPQAIGSPTATSTPFGGLLPDLVIGSPPIVADGKLFVTVVNQGQGDMSGDLVVAVFNADGTKLLGGATLPNFALPAGHSIDVGTGYAVTEDQTLLLIVNPNGKIEESDHTNNRLVVSIAVGGVAQTPGSGGTPTPDIPATLIAMATQTAEAEALTPTPNISARLVALATQTAEAASTPLP